jgi:hypothetical protein
MSLLEILAFTIRCFIRTATPSLTILSQAPPLHIHFDQFESFQVLHGRIGTTIGWSATDRIFSPEDGVQHIPPWKPHDFWPDVTTHNSSSTSESIDSTLLVWAHPKGVPEPMDEQFFIALFKILGEASEKGKMPDLLQLMLSQHVTATAIVMFPRAWWLGPLRWMVPWAVQGTLAWVARGLGYVPLPFGEEKKKNV